MTNPNRIDNQTMVMDIRQLVELSEAKSYFLCLNQNTWLLVQMLHSYYGSWRNRYSQNVDVATPIQPDDEQWSLVMDIYDRGEMELTQVTCLDDLVAAIEGITAQLSLPSSSGGCGCIASGDELITDLDDSFSEEVPTGEEFPPGFSDRPEFDTYRCKAANKILDDYLNTLRNWGGLTGFIGGLTVAVMVGLSLLTIPPAGLVLLLAALGTIAGIDVAIFANLTLIADGMDENRNEIICDIYEANSTGGAVSVIRDAANVEVIELDLGVLENTFLTITDNLISNEAMSILTTKDTSVDGLPEQDCSECGPGGLFFIEIIGGVPCGSLEFGNLTSSGHIESGFLNLFGADRQVIILSSTGEPQDNYFRIDSIVQSSLSAGFVLKVYDETLTEIDSIETANINDFDGYESPACRQFHIFDSGGGSQSMILSFSWSETAF